MFQALSSKKYKPDLHPKDNTGLDVRPQFQGLEFYSAYRGIKSGDWDRLWDLTLLARLQESKTEKLKYTHTG